MAIVKKPHFWIVHSHTINYLATLVMAAALALLGYNSESFAWLPNFIRPRLAAFLSLEYTITVLWVVFALAVCIWIFSTKVVVDKICKPAQEDWALVRFFIEEARRQAYEKKIKDPLPDHHRVTLFKYCRTLPKEYRHWTDPAGTNSAIARDSGWLIPVMRARLEDEQCHNLTVFAVSRDNKTIEGVAGRAWAVKGSLVQTGLPCVTSSNDKFRKKYADQSHCTRTQIDFMLKDTTNHSDVKSLPRTIGAITIVDNAGEDWGVLVFDSKHERAFPDEISDAVGLNEWFSTITKGLRIALGGKSYETKADN